MCTNVQRKIAEKIGVDMLSMHDYGIKLHAYKLLPNTHIVIEKGMLTNTEYNTLKILPLESSRRAAKTK